MNTTRTGFRHVVVVGTLFFSILQSSSLSAQELNFQHIGVKDGLPQTQVQSLHRDALGYLWIGTYGGVGRYNGREIVVFDTDHGLASNTVLAIESSDDGRLWAGTSTGLCSLPPAAKQFSCHAGKPFAGHVINSLARESGNQLLVGTHSGLFRLDANSGEIITNYLDDEVILAIEPGSSGELWVGTRNGLFHIDNDIVTPLPLPPEAGRQLLALLKVDERLWLGSDTGLFLLENGQVRQADLPDTWPRNDVTSLTLARDGHVWAASSFGVLRETPDGFEMLTVANGLPADITIAVLADDEGNVWLGTDDGLSRFAPGPFVSYHQRHGLLHYFVRALAEDRNGFLWLGTRDGAQRIPNIDGQWRIEQSLTLTRDDGLSDPRIYSIAFDNDDVLFATGDGLVRWREEEGIVRRYTVADGLPTNTVESLARDTDGRIWIGTDLGVYLLVNDTIIAPPAPLDRANVVRIREDAAGNLWFGSQNHGLLKLTAAGELLHYGADEGLSDESIWDVATDDSGGVWIGSNGDGLFHIDAAGTINRHTTADGLVNNFIWQVLVDDRGAVWVYTNRGISRLLDDEFSNFDTSDGLSHMEGGATGTLQTSDGNLWFASADGLMRYIPELEILPLPAPPLHIEVVELDGEPLAGGAALPYQPGLLTIDYAALGFQGPDEIRYRYRLGDDDWVYLDRYLPVTFANPNPGEYLFEVQARRPNTDWQQSRATFAFSVATPFWRSAWFMALMVLLVIAVFWQWMRRRERSDREQRRRLEQLVKERTRELEQANDALRNASLTDPLTGLLNRRYLSNRISADIAQTKRMYIGPRVNPNRDLVFIMVDIDHFKRINDTYGHTVGDNVLQGIAEALQSQIRESDYIVRYGGEEFVIVARNTEARLCSVIAERIQRAVGNLQFQMDDSGTSVSVTISLGLSHFPFYENEVDAMSWDQILDIADSAVYMAKALGRAGWVALRCGSAAKMPDNTATLRMIKEEPRRASEESIIEIESSFGALEDVLQRLDAAPRGNT